MKVGGSRCRLPEFMAEKSDMEMELGDLRCRLPEFVAGQSDMKMRNVKQNVVFVYNNKFVFSFIRLYLGL